MVRSASRRRGRPRAVAVAGLAVAGLLGAGLFGTAGAAAAASPAADPAPVSHPAAASSPAADPAPVSHPAAASSPAADPALVPLRAVAPRPAIPDAAMLQPQDLRGSTPEPVTDAYWDRLRPPQPCTDEPYPGGPLRGRQRAVQALVGFEDRPTVVMEHVAVYRPGGAHRYLRNLRRALAACDESGPREPRWTLRATGLAGDESVLLELREYVDFAESYKSTYVAVARIGRALVVVADAGWETGSGHEALVRELIPRAVARAAVLNRR